VTLLLRPLSSPISGAVRGNPDPAFVRFRGPTSAFDPKPPHVQLV
jgi:hypothetical protein